MKFKTNEINSVTKERIKSSDLNLEIEETGKIISATDDVTEAYGLKNIMAGEMVEFEDGEKGTALNLEKDSADIVVLGKSEGLKEGDSVRRLKKLLKVPVREALVGRVVNVLREPIGTGGPMNTSEFRSAEERAKGIMIGKNVHEPSYTGTKAIDVLVPIGRRQRELAIDDRQTGKTIVVIDTIIS